MKKDNNQKQIDSLNKNLKQDKIDLLSDSNYIKSLHPSRKYKEDILFVNSKTQKALLKIFGKDNG